MSDGSLSQDEIDALLSGGGMDFGGPAPAAPSGGGALTSAQVQQLQQLMNQVANSLSSNLSTMIGSNVSTDQPTVELISRDAFLGVLPDELVEIQLDFNEGLMGDHSYVAPVGLATQIAGLMMGQDGVDLNDAALSALEEAGNTIAGSTATILGEKVGTTVMTAPGSTSKLLKASLRLPGGDFVKVNYPMTIEGGEKSELFEIFPLEVAKSLVGGGQAASAPAADPFASMGGGGGADPMAGLMGGGMDSMGGGMGGTFSMGQPNVQSVQLPNLNPQMGTQDQGNIGLLMDVYMEMTVELGRTRKLIKEILGMGEGTIIELDKLAGEPVDILVNHKLIAKGEVVVIDENFGVRVTEIVSPADRLTDMT